MWKCEKCGNVKMAQLLNEKMERGFFMIFIIVSPFRISVKPVRSLRVDFSSNAHAKT